MVTRGPEANGQRIIPQVQEPTSAGSLSALDSSVVLTPDEGPRDAVFRLYIKGFNMSGANIAWYVNGEKADAPSQMTFTSPVLVKGDKIHAVVIGDSGEAYSNTALIVNAPPYVKSLKFVKEELEKGNGLGRELVVDDIDGDDVTVENEWRLNGEIVSTEERIEVPLKRDDRVSLKIRLFDGEDFGGTRTIERTILNSPPIVKAYYDASFDGSLYSYQVMASDPDGDQLAYSLEGEPEGMVINERTGLITWTVPPGLTGKFPVTAVVIDGQGGRATYGLNVNIVEAEKEKS